MKYKNLRNGIQIPMLGMGGWAQTEADIIHAFELGYRLIDTAQQYENENEIGRAIMHSNLKREEIFITTKLWNDDVRNGTVVEAFEKSLTNLMTDYVDLYLIHYPAEGYVKAWDILNELYYEGKVRSIGVSNFQPHHIDDLVQAGLMVPMVNQIETHPFFLNQSVVEYCIQQGIAVEAWCPLGGPGSEILKSNEIFSLARKYNKDNAQIILRWQFQRGIISIPKSTNVEHMKKNIDIFDYKLSVDDVKIINMLNKNARLGADPDNFSF